LICLFGHIGHTPTVQKNAMSVDLNLSARLDSKMENKKNYSCESFLYSPSIKQTQINTK